MEEFNLNSSGVTAKQYILGRRHDRTQLGMLRMGRYLAIDGSTGAEVYIDCLGPHSVLICGKRGYGKSYTMGTLIEEIAMQPLQVSENMASIIIDSMGIFWTLVYANSKEESLLSSWNLKPKSMDVQIFVPKAGKEDFPGPKTNTKILAITPTELSGDDWSTLFNVSSVHPLGVLITRIINDLKAGAGTFALDDILSTIDADTYADTNTKQAAINYFDAVKGWGLFEKDGLDIHEIIRPGGISVIDVSSLPDTVRSMVVGILAKKIYQKRVVARKQYELNRITDSNVSTMPMVWMFLDEAHLFLPRDGQSAAREVLVNEWLRQGRQPGLSLVLATQRPAALHPDVLSQSDIIICHRLTSQDDISALEKVRPTYMRRGIADSIRKMDEGKGVAFIVDDTSEASHVVQMRPRLSWHGGDEPSSLGLYGK